MRWMGKRDTFKAKHVKREREREGHIKEGHVKKREGRAKRGTR